MVVALLLTQDLQRLPLQHVCVDPSVDLLHVQGAIVYALECREDAIRESLGKASLQRLANAQPRIGRQIQIQRARSTGRVTNAVCRVAMVLSIFEAEARSENVE
jgi:hypothetical protein